MTTSFPPPNRPGFASWNISSRNDPSALEFYRTSIADWYEVTELDEAAHNPFFTQNTVCQFGGYVVGRGRSIGQTLSRGPAQIRRSGMDGVSVMLDLAGMRGDVDGVDVRAPAGTIHLRDHSRPSAATIGHVDAVVLSMPREAAPRWLTERKFHGVSIDGSGPMGRLLVSHLSAIGESAQQMGSDDGIAAVEAALVLMERALGNSGQLSHEQSQAVYRSLRAEAVKLIDRGLHNPTLSIEHLIVGLGVSRTTLFRAFSDTGGINLYIKQRRLQKARVALLRRVGHRPTVGEIAHAHGFVSESHFSRAFRDHYGEAPGSLGLGSAVVLPFAEMDETMRYDVVLDWMKGGDGQKAGQPARRARAF